MSCKLEDEERGGGVGRKEGRREVGGRQDKRGWKGVGGKYLLWQLKHQTLIKSKVLTDTL